MDEESCGEHGSLYMPTRGMAYSVSYWNLLQVSQSCVLITQFSLSLVLDSLVTHIKTSVFNTLAVLCVKY